MHFECYLAQGIIYKRDQGFVALFTQPKISE